MHALHCMPMQYLMGSRRNMANPIIPWIGGKRRLADHIFPQFPLHDCYVEVFAGGAALYFLRPPAKVEVINDINGELVRLYLRRFYRTVLTSKSFPQPSRQTNVNNGLGASKMFHLRKRLRAKSLIFKA